MPGVTSAKAAPLSNNSFIPDKKKNKIPLIIQFQHAFLFGTRIPRGERVNSQIGKEKIPQITETCLVFSLLRQLYCTLHSTKLLKIGRCSSFVHIDSYITAWRRKTPRSESWSSTVFRDLAFCGGEDEELHWRRIDHVTTCAEAAFMWRGQNEQKWTHPTSNSAPFKCPLRTTRVCVPVLQRSGTVTGCRRSWFWLLLLLVVSRFCE